MLKDGVSPTGSTEQPDVNIDDLEVKITELESELTEINANNDKLQHFCNELVECKLVLQKVRNDKAIYRTLNMLSLDVTKKCLLAESQDALERAAFDSNSQVNAIFHLLQTREMLPTYFCTNKFTSSLQEIIDSYG
ncbi:hypothetical protein Fmac_000096 [Flemingia macrophylla]|uniref:V-type proton ATPase subunit a n=1 Tax=Flemingia macrophylla TaxID=520843 RepID=A0ABD1NDS6_9FABA